VETTRPDDSSDRTPAAASAGPPLIVGIGASAGGVEALKAFVGNLPSSATRAIFIVAVHLPASSPSHLVSILRETTDLLVEPAADRTVVEPGTVYVMGPGKRIRLTDGVLQVDEAASPHDASTIDHLFRSLASAQGQNCAGVVLSGTGTDGTLGICAIKEAAGLVLAQAPEDAIHDGMPRSAIRTNLIDMIDAAAVLPRRLMDAADTAFDLDSVSTDSPEPDVERLLRHIFERVRERTGHDFANYRRSTILRRLKKRMQVRGRDNLRDYYRLLSAEPAEASALEKEFLITVTRFFRDSEAFSALEETVIPELFDQVPQTEPVRAWVAGCATGEEAYSIAMLLREEAGRRSGSRGVQVFATDIDTDALDVARNGVYPDAIRADLTRERVDRFFEPDDNHLQVTPDLREMVLFAQHDLLGDPPFSRLDLVCCRNLLIYLQPEMQERVFRTLHFSLRASGFLFLGRSEAAGRAADLFKPVDASNNIYCSRRSGSGEAPPSMHRMGNAEARPNRASDLSFRTSARRGSVGTRVHGRALMADVASVLVRKDRTIAHLSDAASDFLKYRSGTPTLPAAVPESMRKPVEWGLRRAFERGVRTVGEAVRVDLKGTSQKIRVATRLVDDPDAPEPLALVRFEPIPAEGTAESGPAASGSAASETASAAPDSTAGVPGAGAQEASSESGPEEDDEGSSDVRRELSETYEQLRTVSEEYETTREEMEAANEELLSMNEALQTKNEELETSKEELQSLNEELEATNQDLKKKVAELREANSVLENLMASTEIATLFLDPTFRIRRFTPRTTELFHIRNEDIGRPIADFTQRFEYDGLLDDVRQVLQDLTPIEREVHQRDDRWFLVRIRPFRTVENQIDGAVITFVEITGRRRAERARRESERFHRLAVEASGVGTWELKFETGTFRLSHRMADLMGYAPTATGTENRRAGEGASPGGSGSFSDAGPGQIEVPLEKWMASIHPEDRPSVRDALQRAKERGVAFDLTYRVLRPGEGAEPEVCWLQSRGNVQDAEAPDRLHGASVDVTERRRLEREIIQTGEEIRHRIGQDLHDRLSSELASAAVRLQNLQTRLEADPSDDGQVEDAAATAGHLAERLRESAGHARSMAYSLIPEPLQEESLPAALRALCKDEEGLAEWTISFQGDAGPVPIDRNVAAHLYRIAREAVVNARKHAGADHVEMKLEAEAGPVVLTVRDNGAGPPAEGFSDGLGVRLMRYRADLIGASFWIGPAEDGGTVVRCEVPAVQEASHQTDS